MKRILSLILCLCIATIGFDFYVLSAETENILTGKVVWTASSNVTLTTGDDTTNRLENLIDNDDNTKLATRNLNAATAVRIFFDLGSSEYSYNQMKVDFESYNLMKINVYTSNVVNAALTPFPETNPPAVTGTSSIRFASYDSPIYTKNFNPYYISTPTSNYPSSQILSFDTKNDRYVCLELTTAYSSSSGEYAGINNIIKGIELLAAVPDRIEIVSIDSVAIPSPLSPAKVVNIKANVLDSSGNIVSDSILSAHEFSLKEEYGGVSINAQTGALTITKDAQVSNIVVVAKCTAVGYEHIIAEKTIALTDVDATERELAEAVANLDFSLISNQKITSVGKNLSLIYPQNNKLTIGNKTYENMNITWSSSNPSIITNDGVVTRPTVSNVTVNLTATLTKQNPDGEVLTATKVFPITVIKVGEMVDMVNIMKGGYGWVTTGWGTASNAVDGTSAAWMLGNHSVGTINAGFRTGSGEIEKYNKIIIKLITVQTEGKMVSCSITGYTSVSGDPGIDGNKSANFSGGSGAVPVLTYFVQPSDPREVTITKTLKEPQRSKYFGISIANGFPANQNNCGVEEFEVYYATPYDVRLKNPETVLYKPVVAGTATFDIPELVVYDEAGDVLEATFEKSIELARSYQGITLSNGKINITEAATTDTVELIYKSWDSDRVWLEKTISIPIEPYTQDYYDAEAVLKEIEDSWEDRVESDIVLLTEKNGVRVSWTSDNEEFVSNTGVVTRPAYTAKDVDVKLTAVLTKGKYSITKVFDVTVIRDMTDKQRVIQDANRIDLGITGVVSSNINLPSVGYYGSSITWSSSNPDIISNTGVYKMIQASKSSVPVTLTATITYNNERITKDIELYAAAIYNESKNSGGGGGGGGGSIGSKGITATPVTDAAALMTEITPEELAIGRFTDVASEHWAKESIEKLAEKKIISGVGEHTFEPDRSITREEFVKMIIVAFGYALMPGESPFKDVQPGMWYEDYVLTASKEGLINGVDENTFGVGSNITREDMAVIIERVLSNRGVAFAGEEKYFNDEIDIADYAKTAVKNLTTLSILSGDDEGNFLPKKNATRAEAAKVLLAAMEKGGVN